MAIAPLQIPQIGAVSGGIDWSPLANLGNVYRQAQQEQQKREALSMLAAGDPSKLDIRPLLASGDMSLAQLGINLQNRQADDAWRREEAQRSQRNSDRSYGLQERQFGLAERAADRADQTPEQKAAERLAAARANGLDPTTPEGRQFVLTGQLPTQPAETAASRAATARQYGLDPTTPQGRAYVLTGKLPEADTTFSTAVEQRKQAAAANGLAPDSPGYQSFVLTGKMPKEDAQPLTATDKKFIEEADNAVLASRNAIDSLNRAKKYSKEAFAGPSAGARGYAASFLGESSDWGKGGIATENLTNEVMTNALGQLKSIFGGNPTEGERAILLDIQGSANKPDVVRQAIYDRAIALAKKRLEFNQQRADELRGGTFYKRDGGTSKGSTQATSANGVPPPPAVGETRGGYKFKGGNPGNPESWVKVAE